MLQVQDRSTLYNNNVASARTARDYNSVRTNRISGGGLRWGELTSNREQTGRDEGQYKKKRAAKPDS